METVISCQPSGKEWNGKPIYSIGLSDGQGGESFSQIPVGTPTNELQIDQSPYGLKIKRKQQGGGFQGGKFQSRNESFAISYAKDIVVGGKTDLKNIFALADQIYAWLEKKKGVSTPPPQAPQTKAAPTVSPTVTANSNNDLPF